MLFKIKFTNTPGMPIVPLETQALDVKQAVKNLLLRELKNVPKALALYKPMFDKTVGGTFTKGTEPFVVMEVDHIPTMTEQEFVDNVDIIREGLESEENDASKL